MKVCEWNGTFYDRENYFTSCNNGFTFLNGGPKENEFKFCPYCGEKILVAIELESR